AKECGARGSELRRSFGGMGGSRGQRIAGSGGVLFERRLGFAPRFIGAAVAIARGLCEETKCRENQQAGPQSHFFFPWGRRAGAGSAPPRVTANSVGARASRAE